MEKLQESGPSGVVPKIMPLELLKQITNNFSEEQKLGSGTFGKVYKGVHSGEEIAVKMLHLMPEHDNLEQFKREFENLRRLRHQNIVQLLGYCYEIKLEYVELSDGRTVFGENIYRALCFQYMHKGSLRKHLSDECHGLDWQTRYKIIKGTCEGLKYLHEGLENPIYHLDLKPDNILLDKDMVPKLADFGLSKLVYNDHTQATQSFVGTIGYLPPEYIERNLVSKKLDIFSLGVVMIQIMSGENGYHTSAYMSSQEFINLVLENWRNRLEETPRCTSLEAECRQVKRAIEIALDCIHADRNKRPNIGDIVHWLNETEEMIKKMTIGSVSMLVSEVESMAVSVAPSSLQLITSRPMETSTEISSIRSTESSKPLDVHPLELRFPWRPNRRIRCPVTITNRTDHYIGVCIKPCCPDTTTTLDLHSLAFWDDKCQKDPCSPIFRLVEPHSTLVVTMMVEEKQLPPPPQEIGMYQVMLLEMRSEEVLENMKSSNGSNFNIASEFVKGVRMGNDWHLTFLRASICDPSSCQEAVIHQLIPETSKDGYMTYIDVHPTETWILVGDTKGWVSIWNYQTKERIMVLKVTKVHTNDAYWVYSAKFIAREQWFITGDDNGWIHVYSYTTKDKMTEFEAHHGTFLDTMAVHPTEPLLLTSTPNVTSIKLWNWSKEWMCIRTFDVPNKQVFRLLWNPRDSNTFTSVSLDRKVKVWNIDSSYPITTLPVESSSATYLSFGSNGNLMATACYRKAFVEGSECAWIWNLHAEKRVHKLGVWGDNHFVACHPTLPILVTLLGYYVVCIWDTRTYRLEKMVQLVEAPLTPEGIVFTSTKDVIRNRLFSLLLGACTATFGAQIKSGIKQRAPLASKGIEYYYQAKQRREHLANSWIRKVHPERRLGQ